MHMRVHTCACACVCTHRMRMHLHMHLWHCNQIIRGLYEPFIADWWAAFGAETLLVGRVEDWLDRPAEASASLYLFLGLALLYSYLILTLTSS